MWKHEACLTNKKLFMTTSPLIIHNEICKEILNLIKNVKKIGKQLSK